MLDAIPIMNFENISKGIYEEIVKWVHMKYFTFFFYFFGFLLHSSYAHVNLIGVVSRGKNILKNWE